MSESYHDASAPLHSSSASEDPYRDAEKECGLRRYRLPTLICVILFFGLGFGLIIWQTVRHHDSDSSDDPAATLTPLSLNTMYNASFAIKTASLAWLGSVQNGVAAQTDTLPADQFISVANGSFFLTTLPDYASPKLLIAAADLAPYTSLTPPVQPTTSSLAAKGNKRRRALLQQQDEDEFDSRVGGSSDVGSLHASDAAASRRGS